MLQFGCQNFTAHLTSDEPTAKGGGGPLVESRAFARIASPLRGCPHSSFRWRDGFIRVPAHDA